MLKVENRESAHLKSRVKDMSVVPNVVSYTGLFAAITPVAKLKQYTDDDGKNLYEPILIRDTDSLIANFGDPRINPEKYIDLYSIMQVVGNGTSCYVAKVYSGDTGIYKLFDGGSEQIELAVNREENTITAAGLTSKPDVLRLMFTNATSSGSGSGGGEDDELGRGIFTFGPITVDVEDGRGITRDGETSGSGSGSGSGTGSSSGSGTGSASGSGAESASGSDSETGETAYLVIDPSWISWSEGDAPYTLTITVPGDTVIPEADHCYIAPTSPESITAYSSMSEALTISLSLSQAKPFSIKVFYLNVVLSLANGSVLASAKIKLEATTTNKGLVDNLNSKLGTYVRFELDNQDHATAAEGNIDRDHSIVMALLDSVAPHTDPANLKSVRENISAYPETEVALANPTTLLEPKFEVSIDDYVNALNQYKDKKYVGCLMADLTAPVTHRVDTRTDPEEEKTDSNFFENLADYPTPEERRTLHYYLKLIACERKDSTVILSTPLYDNDSGKDAGVMRYERNMMTLDETCAWVASEGKYATLWEYGSGNTVDYSIQSFYLEIYYSWLNYKCTHIDNGVAKSVITPVAPSNIVINNILTSYRERGVQYPVAGDQYGTLSDQCTIIKNPKTKLERDQLVQYRINPIWDTGTRGIQIFGNETLNAGYTDLNAAHIARALVYIRSTIDEYTEKLKFSINSLILWDTWKNYVTNYILEPLKSENCLAEYSVAMGTDTTSAAEIANRTIKGLVNLRFYQSAEIFDLTYTVYSSATTLEEAMNS